MENACYYFVPGIDVLEMEQMGTCKNLNNCDKVQHVMTRQVWCGLELPKKVQGKETPQKGESSPAIAYCWMWRTKATVAQVCKIVNADFKISINSISFLLEL